MITSNEDKELAKKKVCRAETAERRSYKEEGSGIIIICSSSIHK